MHILCPHCRNPIELVKLQAHAEIACPSCGSTFHLETESTMGWQGGTAQKLGKYELVETVGQGAFGTVYKARDPELDRLVAIKVPRIGNLAGPQELDRFVREARSVAQLRHPSIVPVHDVGQVDGVPYLVSDFVEGVTVADLLSARRPGFREAAELVAAVADALQYAHECGVIHRDVKPSNIMIGADGTAFLMDFGLAKREAGEITMTIEGQVLGTPAYMPPEQARGEGHAVDARGDVYSLGVVLYQLLTAELPFRGTQRMLLHQVLHDEPRPPRSLNDHIPRDLQTITLRAMAKEPGRRYATARDLADDLRRWLKGEAIVARPVGRMERAVKWVRRNQMVAGLLAALAVSVSVGLAAFFVKYLEAQDKAGIALVHEKKAIDEGNQKEQALKDLNQTLGKLHEESSLKDKALENLRLENRQKMEQLAISNILLAQAAWTDDDAALAGERLGAVPLELRKWEWCYLKRQYQGSLFTLNGNRGGDWSVTFSPDGQRLATGSLDKTARIWDARTGQEMVVCKGHTGSVMSVAFSPDGQRVATASDEYDQTARVWDARTGQPLVECKGHIGGVTNVAFSPDGQRLATAGWDHTVRVWDAGSGESLLICKGHTGPINSVAFSPDGRRMLTGSEDHTAQLWDAATGQPLGQSLRHEGMVLAVAFSPDGLRLATVGDGHTARVWDARTGRQLLECKGHFGPVYSVAFSPDGLRLATGGLDQTARVWDSRTGQLLLVCKGHAGAIRHVCFNPDGLRLATGSFDGMFRDQIATARVWDARPGRPLLEPKQGLFKQVWSVAFSPDGTQLATGVFDNTAQLLDRCTGEQLLVLKGHIGPVTNVAFSPDGTRLATASYDKTARLWDARTGQPLLELKGHTNTVSCVAFSRDGTQLATASWDGTVRLWDARTGNSLLELKGHKGLVLSVVFSPDGTCLATAGGKPDSTARLWNAHTGQQLLELKGHLNGVQSVAFSPDGTRLATVGNFDEAAPLWDARTGEQLLVLKGHIGPVTNVAFSPDGTRLATASYDKTARLWDARTGQPLLELTGHTNTVSCVAFSRDGTQLATASWDGTVRLWDARPITQPPDADELAYRLCATQADPSWHKEQFQMARKANEWYAAVCHANNLLEFRPGHAGLLADRRAIVAERVAHEPKDAAALLAYARLLLEAGKIDDYRKTCAAVSALAGEVKDDALTRRLAGVCVLAPNALPDFKPLLAAFDKTLTGPKKLPEDLRLQGSLLLRATQPEEAVKRLHEAKKDQTDTPHEDLLLALAYHQLKRPDEAKQALARAVAALDRTRNELAASQAILSGHLSPLHALTGLQQPTLPDWRERMLGWQGWLDVQILRREAENTLKP